MERKKAIKLLAGFPRELSIGLEYDYCEAVYAGRQALALLNNVVELKQRNYRVELDLTTDLDYSHIIVDQKGISCCGDPSCMGSSGNVHCQHCGCPCPKDCSFWKAIRGR